MVHKLWTIDRGSHCTDNKKYASIVDFYEIIMVFQKMDLIFLEFSHNLCSYKQLKCPESIS